MEMAFILLWLFLLVAWSAILIGLVFTFRVNHHHCEMCGSTTLCRSVVRLAPVNMPTYFIRQTTFLTIK